MRFCGHCGAPLATAAELATPPRKAPVGERRVLTVLFCDLVGSTRLSQLLEPEDFRLVVLRFREACTASVTRAGGTIGQYLGDGVFAYFGYPRALEDDAQRALRAALHVQAAVPLVRAKLAEAGLHLPVPVTMRIGVHSGLVVVADLGRGRLTEGAAVLGDTPNLAARLQTVATPGSVLASEATMALVGDRFDAADTGLHELAGVTAPVRAFTVQGERPQGTAATARHVQRFDIPCVDRLEERARLHAHWAATLAGAGAGVLLEGEAGMGKTRVACEFRTEIGEPGRDAITLACSPQDRGSSYHPLLVWIRGELGLIDGAEPGVVRAALRHALRTLAPSPHELHLAVLLDCATDAERRLLAASARRRRRDLVDALLAFLAARRHPGPGHLLVVEDIQWADDGTLAVMRRLRDADAAGHGGTMLLATARPQAKTPEFLADVIRLGRLPIEDARALIRAASAGEVSAETVDRIASRTDGIPLYAEEVARLTATSPAGRDAIPLTLRTTLAAQLDRLGRAKPVAQAASALGQVFGRGVLELILSESERPLLEGALRRLLDARLIEPYPQSGDPRALAFRHALIRDAAYDSILRERRQGLHARIARTLAERFANTAQGRPEIVAQHFALAGLRLEAAERYEAAAIRAAIRSTHGEAIAACRRGLEQLVGLQSDTAALETRLQILLAAQVTAVHGNADRAVKAAFERARELAEQTGDGRRLRRALRGLQTYHLVRGDIHLGLAISERIRALAADEKDAGQRIQLHRPYGLTLLYLGRFAEAERELRAAIALYDAAAHADHRFEYGSDPLVLARAHLSWALWFQGQRAAADRESQAAIEAARRLEHAHSLCFALAFRGCLAEFNHAPPGIAAASEELLHLAEQSDFAYWRAWARIGLGWAHSQLHSRKAGRDILQQGLAEYQATGAGLLVPYAQALLARLVAAEDRPQAARLRSAARRAATRGGMGLWHAWLARGVPVSPE